MSKLDHHTTLFRYKVLFILFVVVALAVVGKAAYVVIVQGAYWEQVGNRMKRDSVVSQPTRGNILSCDGQILATSLPEYYLYVDFDCMSKSCADTLWAAKEDSICEGLHAIFPSRSAAAFRSSLREGRAKCAKNWRLWPRRVNYVTYCAVKSLPIFRLRQYTGGFYAERFEARRKPYGSLAARTVGSLYAAKDTARCGIELSYDSLLRGETGLLRRRKVNDRYIPLTDVPAVDGVDIVTTLDVNMQDIAEQALLDELRLPTVNGEFGVAILMEVATGDVKAIVNMAKCEDGEYREVINSAISYRCEPGSVFKTASLLLALDDGVCDTAEVIHTGQGVVQMHSRAMKDHCYPRYGYGDITVDRALQVSSNIGVSTIIDKYYSSDPNKFVDGLARIGLNVDLALPLVGYAPPKIDHIKLNAKGVAEDKTRLPWMSIGYNTQIAPINTLAFYNAIANGGKMVRPRFVSALVKDGEVVTTFPTEVVKEHIAKASTIATMQTMLRNVVSKGVGKQAGSKRVDIAGKTGTAQVSQGSAGYHQGTTGYWLSFVGYFPAQAPRYSCIVCIKKWGAPASGGGMSGVVFRHIAEGVMARTDSRSVSDVAATGSNSAPHILRGDNAAAQYILTAMGIDTILPRDDDWQEGMPPGDTIPDVRGMGAKTAVYRLECCGVKVSLQGEGAVVHQSLAPGTPLSPGQRCLLTLSRK